MHDVPIMPTLYSPPGGFKSQVFYYRVVLDVGHESTKLSICVVFPHVRSVYISQIAHNKNFNYFPKTASPYIKIAGLVYPQHPPPPKNTATKNRYYSHYAQQAILCCVYDSTTKVHILGDALFNSKY